MGSCLLHVMEWDRLEAVWQHYGFAGMQGIGD